MNNICIKQHHIADCGAACLASVAAWYGLRFPLERIRLLSGTQAHGITVQGVREGANALGLQAQAYSVSPELKQSSGVFCLSQVRLPAILHLVRPNGRTHFVVLYDLTRRRTFKIMDPEPGTLKAWTEQELDAQWTGVVIPVAKGEHFQAGNHIPTFFTRMKVLMRPHRRSLVTAFAASLLLTATGAVSAVFMQLLIDNVIPLQQEHFLTYLGGCMAAIALCAITLDALRSILIMRSGLYLGSTLMMGFYRHLMYLPQRFYDQRPSGELTARINDAFKVSSFIGAGLLNIALCVFSLVFAFVIMSRYYWKLALLCALSIPLYALAYYLFDKRNKETQRHIMVSQADLETRLVDTFRGVAQIKYSTAEEQTIEKTQQAFARYVKNAYKGGMNSLLTSETSDLITRALGLGLLWAGATYVCRHQLTTGELISFYALSAYFTAPINDILGFSQKYRDARIASERIFEIIELEPEQDPSLYPSLNDTIAYSLRSRPLVIEHLQYHYPGREVLFSNFSYTFPEARITAIAGESGSGKSTLALLLMRMYSPDAGQIRMGDTLAEHMDTTTWRSQIGFVPQKTALFEGTLLSNITLGCATIDHQRVYDLCNDLGLSDFLASLPLGVLTPLGEQGVQLSGGQRQRIALARAAYRNPPWLILDEATSSLDSSSEAGVLQALQHWRDQGMSILVIAHRMSSLVIADHIVVLTAGAITEEGTHRTLMAQNGQYAAWCRQQGI